MSAIAAAQTRPVRNGKLYRRPTSRPVVGQRILAVEFVSLDGRTWTAIGGGATLTEAIASARESCPDNTSWQPRDWNDLYGD
jgi:hypothetical protein